MTDLDIDFDKLLADEKPKKKKQSAKKRKAKKPKFLGGEIHNISVKYADDPTELTKRMNAYLKNRRPKPNYTSATAEVLDEFEKEVYNKKKYRVIEDK